MNNWTLAGIAAVLWFGAYIFYFRGWTSWEAIDRDLKRLRKAARRRLKR